MWAPDLIVELLSVSSPGASCGSLGNSIDIAFRVSNIGDLRTGPGVDVTFEGDFGAGFEVLTINYAISQSLEPNQSFVDSVSFDTSMHPSGTLPTDLRAEVDAADGERECEELNNDDTITVVGGSF